MLLRDVPHMLPFDKSQLAHAMQDIMTVLNFSIIFECEEQVEESAQGKGTINVAKELNVNDDIYEQLNFVSMINP